MAHIRSWADIKARAQKAGFDDPNDWLTPAERQLRDAAVAGEPCGPSLELPPVLAEGEEPDPDLHIRADVLRYFILGGCDTNKIDDVGVRLVGAHISGSLNLDFTAVHGALYMIQCHFDQCIYSVQTRVASVALNGSRMNGWRAQRLHCLGNVFLDDIITNSSMNLSGADIGGQFSCIGASFEPIDGQALNAQGIKTKGGVFLPNITAKATVALNGADIGGQLNCEGARFEATDGDALNAQRIKTKDGVFLPNITAKATVDLSGANIGGQLSCTGASLETTSGQALNAQGIKTKDSVFLDNIAAKATVDLSGADIGGQLVCEGAKFGAKVGEAFFGQNTTVREVFFWKPEKAPERTVILTDAHAGVLCDDPKAWPSDGKTVFDGFTYDRIIGAPTDARTRTDWLDRGPNYMGTFAPQPYTQLAKVLREMGHERDASAILMAREEVSNRHGREKMQVHLDGTWKAGFASLWWDYRRLQAWFADWAFRRVAGYGYRPLRSVVALLGLIAITWGFAWMAYGEGSFAPNSDVIQTSSEWVALAKTDGNPAELWSDKTGPGRDWETFHPLAYALDVVVPIVNFGQTEAWAPSTERGPWGWHLWWLKWVMTGLGWIVTAVGAAALAGIARRD